MKAETSHRCLPGAERVPARVRLPVCGWRDAGAMVLAAMLALCQTGCDQVFQERAERALDKAQQKVKDGDFQAAIGFYETALDGTVKTADVHYDLGLIYNDKLKNPVGALYHFQRYLDLDPNGSHAKDAKKLIAEARLPLASSLSSGGVLTQEESVRLKNENLSLRKQLAELHALQHQQALRASESPGASTPQVIPPGSRTYTVQPGDTIASISRRFYKSIGRIKDIEDANYSTLGPKAKIKPGQVLVIPK